MDEDSNEVRKNELLEQMSTLIKEFVHVTDAPGPTPGIVIGAVIAFEAVRYDDEGNQMFRTDYFSLPPTSYTGTLGILQDSLWQLQHRNYGHCD